MAGSVWVSDLKDVCFQAPEDARVFVWSDDTRNWDAVVALMVKRPGDGVRLLWDGPLPYSAGEIEDDPVLHECDDDDPVKRFDGKEWVECDAIWYEEIDNTVYIQ